jgi:alkanesulfonate monooxygenase SsuD/methylene tetrahydromethanopterin reductase-like flavin-dependent oxidoreductase (luciferase family)
MRIGILILPTERWEHAADQWRLADDLGFDHAWAYDHIAWRELAGTPWFSAVPTLAAAATVTKRIRLGTLVSSPNFRNPVSLAKEVITLDDISHGRFILGIGAGATGADAAVLGQPRWSPAERGARFAEFVALTDTLLRQPVVDYAGRFYSANSARTAPRCRQRPRVPFAVAATGPRGMEVAVAHADIWVTNGVSARGGQDAPVATPDIVGRQVARLRRICTARGRDPATLRILLLNVNRNNPPLTSVDRFMADAGSYADCGVTDLVVPFPRREPPFVGSTAVLHQVADHLLPALHSRQVATKEARRVQAAHQHPVPDRLQR